MEPVGHQETSHFSCPICHSRFGATPKISRPYILKCGHTFCLACLQNLEMNDLHSCPICKRKHCVISQSGSRKYIRNFGLEEAASCSIPNNAPQKKYFCLDCLCLCLPKPSLTHANHELHPITNEQADLSAIAEVVNLLTAPKLPLLFSVLLESLSSLYGHYTKIANELISHKRCLAGTNKLKREIMALLSDGVGAAEGGRLLLALRGLVQMAPTVLALVRDSPLPTGRLVDDTLVRLLKEGTESDELVQEILSKFPRWDENHSAALHKNTLQQPHRRVSRRKKGQGYPLQLAQQAARANPTEDLIFRRIQSRNASRQRRVPKLAETPKLLETQEWNRILMGLETAEYPSKSRSGSKQRSKLQFQKPPTISPR